MYRTRLPIAPALILFLGLANAASSSSQSTSLDDINRTLETIAETLKAQTENQRSSLLLSRLLIDSNGLVALESSIREVRSEHDGLVAQLGVYQRRIKEEEDRIFEETVDLGQDETAKRLREELDFARVEMEKLEQKAFRLEQTMIDMENEQDRRRAATETLKEAIDRALGLRP